MEKKLHLGIGHYGIGFKDGVNTVIARNVHALREIDPEMKITLFGKPSPDYEDYIEPIPGLLEYLNIDEFDPEDLWRQCIKKTKLISRSTTMFGRGQILQRYWLINHI